MSEKSYETLPPTTSPMPTFQPLDLDKFGLQPVQSQLTLALQTIIFDKISTVNPVGGGILLFGSPGCGEDYLLDTVLTKSPKVAKIILNWEKTLEIKNGEPEVHAEEFITNAFDKARSYNKVVLVIDKMQKLFDHSAIATIVVSQVRKLFEGNKNIFVFGHLPQPWKVEDAVMQLFKYKIHVPFPTTEVKAELLEFYLKKVTEDNELKRGHNLSESEFMMLAALPSLSRATWEDLNFCAFEAFQNALRAKLGLNSDYNPRQLQLMPSVAQSIKAELMIGRDHVHSALMRLSPKKCTEEQLQAFIAKWNIPCYEGQSEKKKKDEERYRKKKVEDFWDWFYLFWCSCAETCC